MPHPKTGRPVGRPPKPIEVKRAIGNPGGRRLPAPGTLAVLHAATGVPEPMRPLAEHGLSFWRRAWRAGVWLSLEADGELVQSLAEKIDEGQALRAVVMRGDGDRYDRQALRAIDAQIMSGLAAIGFTPADRARMNVAEVTKTSKLEGIIRTRREATS